MIAHCSIDEPMVDATVQRHGFAIAGWALPAGGARIVAVEVKAGRAILGATRLLYPRLDVDAAFSLAAGERSGFTVDCFVPNELRGEPGVKVVVEAIFADGTRAPIGMRAVRFSKYDHRLSPLGYQFEPGFETVIRRDQVYATGAPSPIPSPECLDIVLRYLEPGARVLDVGCGIGAYGHAFRKRGRSWTGCEVRQDFVDAARADGLDVQLVEGDRLPFEDESFDAVMAVEVVEHLLDPEPLLAEMARVAPAMGLFSVPNFETIPVTAVFFAIPFHMLEPDHRSFFSHGSLAATLRPYYEDVEVFEYGTIPLLRSLDGLPLKNHLFAVAKNSA